MGASDLEDIRRTGVGTAARRMLAAAGLVLPGVASNLGRGAGDWWTGAAPGGGVTPADQDHWTRRYCRAD